MGGLGGGGATGTHYFGCFLRRAQEYIARNTCPAYMKKAEVRIDLLYYYTVYTININTDYILPKAYCYRGNIMMRDLFQGVKRNTV